MQGSAAFFIVATNIYIQVWIVKATLPPLNNMQNFNPMNLVSRLTSLPSPFNLTINPLDGSYYFKVDTSTYQRQEIADSNGNIKGQRTIVNPFGNIIHNVNYETNGRRWPYWPTSPLFIPRILFVPGEVPIFPQLPVYRKEGTESASEVIKDITTTSYEIEDDTETTTMGSEENMDYNNFKIENRNTDVYDKETMRNMKKRSRIGFT